MLTYRVLSHIPDFVPLGGMVLGGVWWITHRREEVALAEGRKSSVRSKGESPETSNENETANKNGRKL
jgi:formate dehydrogenase iron-sulfur subunit